jgi:NitT/TauT family transport system ATP-binding protein
LTTELQFRLPPAPAGQQSEPAVDVEALRAEYHDQRGKTVVALDALGLTVPRGEVHAVVGPSGCGKTTLLELICGLRTPARGRIACEPAALMPQRDLLLPWLNAIDNAGLALRIAGRSRAQARAAAEPIFAELGLDGFEAARPDELSGGMRQRVAFLRTLLAGKPLLCLDEPFGALDAITRREVQAWLSDALVREPRTVVLVTHDVEEAIVLADRVSILSPRPGHVVAELEVALPRPRRATDAAVVELRERALAALASSPGGPIAR